MTCQYGFGSSTFHLPVAKVIETLIWPGGFSFCLGFIFSSVRFIFYLYSMFLYFVLFLFFVVILAQLFCQTCYKSNKNAEKPNLGFVFVFIYIKE